MDSATGGDSKDRGNDFEEEGKEEVAMRQRTTSKVRDDNRKQALERLGVFVPKSKEETEVAELRKQVAQLEANLERERAQRFHDEQSIKSQQVKDTVSASAELAGLSRKLHAERVSHQKQHHRHCYNYCYP